MTLPVRIYFSECATLADLNAGPDAPRTGDHVVFFRDAQDMDGSARAQLRSAGVIVTYGPDLLSAAHAMEIDSMLDRYLKSWFMDGGEDISRADQISLGRFLSGQLTMAQKPTLLVASGEIFRLVLAGAPGGTVVYGDFRDGETPFQRQLRHQDATPRRRLLKRLVEDHGSSYRDLAVARPLPPIHRSGGTTGFARLLRILAGGLRPRYLAGRLRARRQSRDRPAVYVFFNHGLRLVAESLARSGRIAVFGNQAGHPGVTPLRPDHVLALPSGEMRRAAKRMRARCRALIDGGVLGFDLACRGFDYSPYLLAGLATYLRRLLPLDLVLIAQARKLFDRCGFALTVINGAAHAMYGAIGYGRATGTCTLYVEHGLNLFESGLRNAIHNEPDVIYGIHGTDHMAAYGRQMPAGTQMQWRPLPNPATAVTTEIRRPDAASTRRVLLANYWAGFDNGCSRYHAYDRYMIELMTAARVLVTRKYKVSYRPHPGEAPAYVRYVIERTGLADQIAVDESPNFETALAHHHVFVANATSCIYQALFGGWPTIFYEPDFDPDRFVGMPAATDIFRPVAGTPDELVAMVEQAFDPESDVARFPERFRTTYAERFIGRGAERADEVIADFIVDQLSGQRKSVAA